nr:hypothetical protein [Saprospiraceae bacterium]
MSKLYNILIKHGQLFAIILSVLIVGIFFLIVTSGSETFDQLPEEEQYLSTIFDFGLYAAFYLIIINAIIALAFGVWFIIAEPKRSLKLIIGLVVLIVFGLILYSTADAGLDGPIAGTLSRFDISEGVSRFVSAGLSTTIVLIALAALSIVVAEVINLIKN